MRDGAPAFRAGDRLKVKTAAELDAIWSSVTSQSLLSLHQVLDPEKERYAESRVQVTEVLSYHGNIPVYRLNDHQYIWPEDSLIDPVMDYHCDTSDPCCPAHYVYRDHSLDRRIEIVDCDNYVYCSLAKVRPQLEAKWVNEIARIRHVRAFELLFGFDGKDFLQG
ncbi:hypothetical protein SH467x_004407 [Pirellulaceae bacterium SH467]